MRTTAIVVQNNQTFEIFVEKHEDHFEIWTVGPVKGRRVLLDHHLTHDDVEAHLEYAKPGDLVWHDATSWQIPKEKIQNAIEYEETIKRGAFLDYEDWPEEVGRSVTRHLRSISHLTIDRRESMAAKKALIGRWTDGVVTMGLEPNNKLRWSCTDFNHPLNIGERYDGHAPDWWNFGMWELHLMNDEHKCGTHTGVLRVGKEELHISGKRPHRIAYIFRRV